MALTLQMIRGTSIGRAALLGATALGALGAGTAAHAQASDAEAQSGLGVIVVTATRVEESQQSVPVAVTAFSGEDLVRQNALDVQNLERLAPGFRAREAKGSVSSLYLTIRGQVQNDTISSLDPSVGVYVDELYLARSYGVNTNLLDVSGVQVLRGPQGTLFGRNTTGGALVLSTNDPDPSEWSLTAAGSYGRFDEFSGSAVVNLPVVEDVFAIRAAAGILNRDGYRTDSGYANNIGGNVGLGYEDRDSFTGRLKVLVQPTEQLSIILSGEYLDMQESRGGVQTIFAYQPGSRPGVGGGSLAAIAAAAGDDINDYISFVNADPDNISQNVAPYLDLEAETYSARVNLETSFGEAVVIAGLRNVRQQQDIDLDGSPYAVHYTSGRIDSEQISIEARLSGTILNDALDFVVGASYLHETGFDQSYSAADDSTPISSILEGIIDNDSVGLFGQATWHATDQVSITGGIRYSVDDKGIVINNRLGSIANLSDGGAFQPVPGLNFCLFPTVGVTPNDCTAQRRDDFEGVSYTLGVDYQVTPDVLLYAKTGRGFRSGGQNLRAIVTPLAFQPFQPEIAYQHEIGIKSEWFDNRLRFNAAAYYTDISDFQASILVAGPTGAATIVQNAASVTIWGIEAELLAEVAEGFTIGATAAMTKPEFDEYLDFFGNDLSNSNFENVPEHSFSISADYETYFGRNRLNLHADYSWQDEIFQEDSPDPAIQQFVTSPAGGVMNVRASMSFSDDLFEVAVYGRNIFDNRDLVSALNLVAPYGYINGRFREPATYGVSARLRWSQ